MKYIVNTYSGDVAVEATGHFFATEDAAKGYLILVNKRDVVAAFKEFSGFVIDQSTMPVVDAVVEPVQEAA